MITATAISNCTIGTIADDANDFNLKIIPLYRLLRNEGNLVYEYNPLRNLRLANAKYETNASGVLIDEDGNEIYYNGEKLKLTVLNNLLNNGILDEAPANAVLTDKSGALVDFTTTLLNFDLNHPVQIECQPSYDGSINLVLNDDLNPPRLINSRFTPLENNTYKIATRIGNNDTSIYDEETFDIDTSLYKKVSTIPQLDFLGLQSGGNLRVGNYTFYFKLEDVDGNQTDFVSESGIVSCYVGGINDVFSIHGGIAEESSYKQVSFELTNLDSGYDYVRVYYTKNTSDYDGQNTVTAHMIDTKYYIKGSTCKVLVTGMEPITDISLEEINAQYQLATTVKTQAQCQNRLFLGNIFKPTIPYEELSDLSLRVYPIGTLGESIGNVGYNYSDNTTGLEYYNADNVYYNLGYWNKEIYRLGIVYILNDYSLSPVFDIRGRNELPIHTGSVGSDTISQYYTKVDVYKGDEVDSNGNRIRNKININEEDYGILVGDSNANRSPIPLENTKGTVRFTIDNSSILQYSNQTRPIGVKMAIDGDAINELKKYVKGFFFVRQQRIPTILAQALTIGLDKNAKLPLIKADWQRIDGTSDTNGKWIMERFIDNERNLTHDFKQRLYDYTGDTFVTNKAAICPEAELNIPTFNQKFTGGHFTISKSVVQPVGTALAVDSADDRHFYVPAYSNQVGTAYDLVTDARIVLVEDDTKNLTIGGQKYSSRAGDAEEAWRVSYAGRENVSSNADNVVRGVYGTYLGIEGFVNSFGQIIDIHVPGYDVGRIYDYFRVCYEDKSAFYPISDRITIGNIYIDSTNTYFQDCYRGDCYICNYTHRMNRNFQDPESPTNDVIVETSTWRDNYDPINSEANANINRADVNAVQIGHWVTFKLCSNINLSLRSVDNSYYSEEGLTGLPRNFYPLYSRSITGESKIPESSVRNTGLSRTTSDKWNFSLPDVPYIKNEFETRIMYSDVHVNDSFKNGYRTFHLLNYRDYSRVYGGLTRLVEFQGNLIAVFEHGVALIPVNERVQAGSGVGGNTYINTPNVLPDNPLMLSTNYGTQWIESVIVSSRYVYGIDTVGKKIWRTNGQGFELISDFKIGQFLNNNITLGEREMTPTMGVRNVKAHYNSFKQDILFTFYDNLYGMEEKVWHICYNELLDKWITFYSWVPSFSAAIDNIFFTFDRTTSKWIAKLAQSNALSTTADGIVLSSNLVDDANFGTFSIAKRSLPEEKYHVGLQVTYEFGPDNYGHHKYFNIEGDKLAYLGGQDDRYPVFLLNIKANVKAIAQSDDDNIAQYVNGWNEFAEVNYGYFQNTVVVSSSANINNLTTDFWKHGKAGLIDIADKIYHTKWYGEIHPFEFEFIVTDRPGLHKIFENLYIIGKSAEPESFHFDIEGDVYEFANDKPNMYYRQEATKELYQNLGCDILFDRDYEETPISQNVKSTLFPWYYEKIDTYNEIYSSYQLATSKWGRDYQNLTGSEIIYDEDQNEYRILTHQKGNDLKKVGRLRGNMQYKESLWNVEIRPINFVQRNEDTWQNGVPPIILNNLPNTSATEINPDDLPTDYDITDIENTSDDELIYTGWTDRKETRIRDKYCRIRVRYSGNNPVTVNALRTIYTNSYA